MNKEEARKKIKEVVKYLIDTDDNDVLESYTITLVDILQQYTQQERKKYAVDFVRDFTYKIPRHLIEVEYDDWLNQQEGER